MEARDALQLIDPSRKVDGVSAVLLPYTEVGDVDWSGFDKLLERTVVAGLTPAVNMDTGYANLLDEATRRAVLERTRGLLSGSPFVAGAYVADNPGDDFAESAYAAQFESIQSVGGMPIAFQSYGLAHQPDEVVLRNYHRLGEIADAFLAFELGEMFAPFGRIYSLDVYRGLMGVAACRGAKHSSLQRDPEWDRLRLRNEVRPDFRVYTGNDLAIDMVIYGSDYLLGLSTLAPDAFATRDRLWQTGDSGWNTWNDVLQHLGFLAFRDPVPAYKHSAALFLAARGWIASGEPHPQCPRRESADRELLEQVATQIDAMIAAESA